MHFKQLHDWDITAAQARQIQIELQSRIKICPMNYPPKRLAGVDCSISRDEQYIIAGIVVLEKVDDKFHLVDQVCVQSRLTFPYVPGLLSFREVPVCLQAAALLKIWPDVFLFDGQGLAHPRRLGLACHAGLILNTPTVGCAKSCLIGDYQEPGKEKGCRTTLIDKDEEIGCVLRTRSNVKPVFVSIGHLITISQAVQLVLDSSLRFRLPEPARMAHQAVSCYRIEHP